MFLLLLITLSAVFRCEDEIIYSIKIECNLENGSKSIYEYKVPSTCFNELFKTSDLTPDDKEPFDVEITVSVAGDTILFTYQYDKDQEFGDAWEEYVSVSREFFLELEGFRETNIRLLVDELVNGYGRGCEPGETSGPAVFLFDFLLLIEISDDKPTAHDCFWHEILHENVIPILNPDNAANFLSSALKLLRRRGVGTALYFCLLNALLVQFLDFGYPICFPKFDDGKIIRIIFIAYVNRNKRDKESSINVCRAYCRYENEFRNCILLIGTEEEEELRRAIRRQMMSGSQFENKLGFKCISFYYLLEDLVQESNLIAVFDCASHFTLEALVS